MENLPQEILIEIFSHLDGHSLFHASKVCQLWLSLINHSIEIASKFSFKVHSGENIMPDFMDYNHLRHLCLNFAYSKDKDNIKIKKFWPNLRTTEVCDIIDEDGLKFTEIMDIFNEYGRLWKSVIFHDVKLQKISHFSMICETLSNVNKMKLNAVNVDEVMEEINFNGLTNLTSLEMTKVNWRIFKVLKHCKSIKSLILTSRVSPMSDDFHEFLINNEQLKHLELFGHAKHALVVDHQYKFQLEKLVIDRSNSYLNRSEVDVKKLSDFDEFLHNQRSSLKKIKFKGLIEEKNVAKIAREMNLRSLNIHFTNEDNKGGERLTEIVRNSKLEKLYCVGSMNEILMAVKYFPAIKSLKLNNKTTFDTPDLFTHLIYQLPQLKNLKIFKRISFSSTLDPSIMKFNYLETLRIDISEYNDVMKLLKICPSLKELSLLTEFNGNADNELEIISRVEDLTLIIQDLLSSQETITKIHKLLQCLPNLINLKLNSPLMGKLIISKENFPSIEGLKIDLISSFEQCKNMYDLINCCRNLKSLEVISRMVEKFEISENFHQMETLSIMGFSDEYSSFENLTNLLKFCPYIKKFDFWIRGSDKRSYKYQHSDKIKHKEPLHLMNLSEFHMWRFHKSEIEILNYILRSSPNVRKLKIGPANEDIEIDDLEKILAYGVNIEDLSFGKNYKFNGENLKIIKLKLRNLKKLEIFADQPLEIRGILRDVFGEDCKIEFIINPDCLEEWTDDDIVKI